MSPESLELNKKLEELTHKEEFSLPFHTFGWRNIDFDKEIPLGLEPFKFDNEQPYKQLVGFLGKPKHGYTRWKTTNEQSLKIKELCVELTKESNADNCNKLIEYLQTCREVKGEDQSNITAGN